MKNIAIACFLCLLSACSKKPPYTLTNETGTGVVLGQESCSSVNTKNAWLINLSGPNNQNKTYGDTITFGGFKYYNVVKSFNLPFAAQIQNKKFFFQFLQGSKSVTTSCDVHYPSAYDLTEINILQASISDN